MIHRAGCDFLFSFKGKKISFESSVFYLLQELRCVCVCVCVFEYACSRNCSFMYSTVCYFSERIYENCTMKPGKLWPRGWQLTQMGWCGARGRENIIYFRAASWLHKTVEALSGNLDRVMDKASRRPFITSILPGYQCPSLSLPDRSAALPGLYRCQGIMFAANESTEGRPVPPCPALPRLLLLPQAPGVTKKQGCITCRLMTWFSSDIFF